MILSVVVPIHNTESYLADCIDSIMGIDLPDFEIILVDDGSTDRSLSIAQGYAERYPATILVHTQPACGPGRARNLGIETARGKYIAFVDSDDLVPSRGYPALIAAAEKSGAELVIGTIEAFNDKRRWLIENLSNFRHYKKKQFTLAEYPNIFENSSPCNKIFLKSFLLENGFRFMDSVKYAEDFEFMSRCYSRLKQIHTLNTIVYHYRARSDANNPSTTQKNDLSLFQDYERVCLAMNAYFAEQDSTVADVRKFIATRLMSNRFDQYLKGRTYDECLAVCRIMGTVLQDVPARIFQKFLPPNRLKFALLKDGLFDECIRLVKLGVNEDLVKDIAVHKREKSPETIVAAIELLTSHLKAIKSRTAPGISASNATEAKAKSSHWFRDTFVDSKTGRLQLNALGREWKLILSYFIAVFLRLLMKRQVWIVGERLGQSARDTSYHFFKYCREHHPKKSIYYVIARGSKDYKVVKKMGHCLRYGSLRHFVILHLADACVFNDCNRDVMHHWSRISAKPHFQKKVKCFLQHGVIGLTGMGNYYHKNSVVSRGESIDIFITSSDLEKKIVMEHLGFSAREVAVTGLSRFDNLFQVDRKEQQILYVPTWRPWLKMVHADDFKNSAFYQDLNALMHHPQLQALLEQRGLTLKVCLHFAMNKFIDDIALKYKNVEITFMDKVDFQREIIASQLLITDYSSVSFDFAYQKKPVIFYRHDENEYFFHRGKSLIHDSDLFGNIVRSHQELFQALESNVKRGFSLDDRHRVASSKFFSYNDRRNSERIFQRIWTEVKAKRKQGGVS